MDTAKGTIFYGLHFYPGVAEYKELEGSKRVYLSEDTLRKMDPSFQGAPVFIDHVSDVASDLATVKKEADGWVVESFYNLADGKHWAKMVIVSDQAANAIRQGFRLSNAYYVSQKGDKGVWNGVDYDYEILDGNYEHLALVRDPRYAESVIMTPEEFKKYNQENLDRIEKLKNSKDNQGVKMKFSFFKKTKVENSDDLALMSVILPKTGLTVELSKLINEADEMEAKKNDAQEADAEHVVKIGDESISVGELLKRYEELMKEKEDEVENEDEKKEEEPKEEPKAKENEEPKEEPKKEEPKKENSFSKNKDKKPLALNKEVAVKKVITNSSMLNEGKRLFGSK